MGSSSSADSSPSSRSSRATRVVCCCDFRRGMDATTLALNISIWRASPISSHAIHTTQKHTPRAKFREKNKNKKKKRRVGGREEKLLYRACSTAPTSRCNKPQTSEDDANPASLQTVENKAKSLEKVNGEKKTETLEICIPWQVHRQGLDFTCMGQKFPICELQHKYASFFFFSPNFVIQPRWRSSISSQGEIWLLTKHKRKKNKYLYIFKKKYYIFFIVSIFF